MADLHNTYDALTKLSPTQFSEVVIFSGVPPQYMPPDSEPVAKRAQALIDWAGSTEANHTALRSALNRKHGGVVTLAARQPPPRHFSLLFDRDDQEDKLNAALQEVFQSRQRVVTILLPGPPSESHADFVARYEKFNLRKVCRDGHSPYHVHSKPLDWPSPNLAQERRFKSLLQGLSELIGQESSPGSDAQMEQTLRTWLAKDRQHKIIHYQLFRSRLCKSDAVLVKRWVDFWSRLDLGEQPYSITVFFCIRCPDGWLSNFIGRAAGCIRTVRRTFKARPNVLILGRLEAPSVEDVEPWVEKKCGEAWGMELGQAVQPESSDPLPLNYDALRFHAEEAFRRKVGSLSWKTRRAPFSLLKTGLEHAIEEAHKAFVMKGSGR